ncbi:MAG: rhodanese-like domain-containing protein, partial [Flavisolibacter sp.]
INQQILLVAEEGKEDEVTLRLARVGFDHTLGHLKGGIAAWTEANKETDHIRSIEANELADKLKTENVALLDVRRPAEYMSEHVVGATSMPLDYINDHINLLDKDQTYYVHCAGGYRSMIFASILKARGFNNIIDVKGGFKAIKETNRIPVTDYVSPTTLVTK